MKFFVCDACKAKDEEIAFLRSIVRTATNIFRPGPPDPSSAANWTTAGHTTQREPSFLADIAPPFGRSTTMDAAPAPETDDDAEFDDLPGKKPQES